MTQRSDFDKNLTAGRRTNIIVRTVYDTKKSFVSDVRDRRFVCHHHYQSTSTAELGC
jgi:hypothetical protein